MNTPLEAGSDANGQTVFALVNGEPLHALPADLYIPPDALAVYLQSFEGPLDVLSWLIRRNRLDVLNIPMAELTAQYMRYVDLMRALRFELAAEYLVMAVWLIEIKSRLLLPGTAGDDESGGNGDPRAELVRRLIEYEQIREAAVLLDGLPQLGRDMFAAHLPIEAPLIPLPGIDLLEFPRIWQDLLTRGGFTQHHRAARRELSVRAAMARLLTGLQGELFVEFQGLFEYRAGVALWVVNFLALLELARECQVEIVQNQAFAPIYLRSGGADNHAA